MVGYAVLIIAFPAEMTTWPRPEAATLSMAETLAAIAASTDYPDGLSGATALDYAKTQLALQHDTGALRDAQIFGHLGAAGWEWIAIAYLLGGAWLLWRGVIRWHIPIAMLTGLLCLAFACHLIDAHRYASPVFHLFAGATLLGAFFIATDPVTAAGTPRGRLVYGAGIGVLVYVIRTWGGYPDGVAFAVLLMNMAAPAIDYFLSPERTRADEQP